MEKGFNSDIVVKGISLHVQTEDWGNKNPFIVTKVFSGGAVKATIKTPYSYFISVITSRADILIKNALRKQHADTIDDLVSGKINI